MGKAEELAAAVEGLGKRKRRNYPGELRQQIADHVLQQRAAGVPLKTISKALGVGPTLLRRWEVERTGAFRRVELTGGNEAGRWMGPTGPVWCRRGGPHARSTDHHPARTRVIISARQVDVFAHAAPVDMRGQRADREKPRAAHLG